MNQRARRRHLLHLSALGVVGALCLGCGGDAAAPTGDAGRATDSGADGSAPAGDSGPPRDHGMPTTIVQQRARALAQHLRGHTNFMVGMGNDLDGAPNYDPNAAGAFTLGTTLDLHYAYLVGYGDAGGWPTWNTDGAFVTIQADAAERNGGVTPMFTYYQLALEYENGQDALTDAAKMRQWLLDVELLFTRLGSFDEPAVVGFEPDLFGFLQQRLEGMSTTPADYAIALRHSGFNRCDALPERLSSLGACLVAIRDALAPKVRIGAHASGWAVWTDPVDPEADIEAAAMSHAAFLSALGADELDFVGIETLDRDAGFWETSGGTAACSISGGSRGPVYWDETNATLPNFDQHFRWVGALTDALELPALWWQMPFGVPSETCGGSNERWRDNRVRYFFSHIDQAIAAGGAGMVFGTGAGGQTYITTDDGQFSAAAAGYFAAPHAL